jgi:hypothetical protein
VARLDALPLTEPGGLVIAQIHPREHPNFNEISLSRLRLGDERRYGSTQLLFFDHSEDTPA